IQPHAHKRLGVVPPPSQLLHERHSGTPLLATDYTDYTDKAEANLVGFRSIRVHPCNPWQKTAFRLLEGLEAEAVGAGVVAEAALLVFLVLAVVALEELH